MPLVSVRISSLLRIYRAVVSHGLENAQALGIRARILNLLLYVPSFSLGNELLILRAANIPAAVSDRTIRVGQCTGRMRPDGRPVGWPSTCWADN